MRASQVLTLILGFAITAGVGQSAEKLWIDERCRCLELPEGMLGPFVELSDGSLLVVEGNATRISRDDGKTWSGPRTIYTGPKPGIPDTSGVLLRTQDNVIVLVYMDMSTYQWGWNQEAGEAVENARLDVWTIRSLDEGKTWVDRQRILEGYCGALIDIIQTKAGHIVVPVQLLLRSPGRHALSTYVSTDAGKTWKRSNIIDLGGHGHHDGALEPTLAELNDGRVWMLIRTNWDRFWEAYSMDHGYSWRVIQPTRIDSSSSPGFMSRLASGRLVLVWNRLYPSGKKVVARRNANGLSEAAASWQREELSIAFSQDEGKSWSEPVVFARLKTREEPMQLGEGRKIPMNGLSYPAIFERRKGELWITTRYQGHLQVALPEDRFVQK
jgi:hypothetical protein